jgi:NAD(P)-dependent dehydrogenase (short-subunit alcohol dehydrogenase family)
MTTGLKNLQSRLVVITGGASGIGLETARAFAQAGASLVLADLDTDRLDAARKAITELGAPCLVAAVDVTDPEAMGEFAGWLEREARVPDIVVNNAGIGYLGPLVGSPLESWKSVFDVNVMGVVHGCRAFLPGMIAAGGKRRVVNVASIAGVAGAPNMSAYAASKHAVIGLSEVLSMELEGTDIGLTIVCPGIIDTAIMLSPRHIAPMIPLEQVDRMAAYYRRRGTKPAVVAAAIVKAVRRGSPIVLIGHHARATYHLKRVSRGLARRAILAFAKVSGYL